LRPVLAGAEPAGRPALSFRDTRYVAYRTPARKVVAAFEPYDGPPRAWVPWQGLVAMARLALGPHRPEIGVWRLDEDPAEHRNLAARGGDAFRALYAPLMAYRQAHPPRAVASAAEPGLDEPARHALEALGYVD
jgi:hypothetical protein